ncbi:hypothetical protein BJX62DRAFT_209244 [Aspergillus germanicus]
MPLVKQPAFFCCISFLLFLAHILAEGMVPYNDSHILVYRGCLSGLKQASQA